jgi:hypothetical protein
MDGTRARKELKHVQKMVYLRDRAFNAFVYYRYVIIQMQPCVGKCIYINFKVSNLKYQ